MPSPLELLPGGAFDDADFADEYGDWPVDPRVLQLAQEQGIDPADFADQMSAGQAPPLAAAAPRRSPYADQAGKLIQSGLAAIGDPSQQMEADRAALRAQGAALKRDPSIMDNPLLRMGLEMMVSASRPGATFLGSVGAGGKEALDFKEKQKAADELRALKMAQIEREVARLPFTYGQQQLELGSKLASIKPANPFMSAGRFGIFNTETGKYEQPPAGMPGLAGNKRLIGNPKEGIFVWDPNDPNNLKPLREGQRQAEFGLTPTYGVDENGNPVLMQVNDQGVAVATKLPPGVTPAGQFEKVDLGTEFALVDKQTRRVVERIPKDVAGAKREAKVGEAQGQAIVDLPTAIATAEQALTTIEDIRNHPGRTWGTGATGVIPGIPGTQQKDFITLVDQAKGKAFLEAFNSLKGAGQITQIEGDKATAAIARLDRAQSEKGFLKALDDLESVIKGGIARARQKAGVGAPSKSTAPTRLKFNPETGAIE